jgi:hypothetical protein
MRIGARVKSGQGWNDVVIRNVSARGVLGECPAPAARSLAEQSFASARIDPAFEFVAFRFRRGALRRRRPQCARDGRRGFAVTCRVTRVMTPRPIHCARNLVLGIRKPK